MKKNNIFITINVILISLFTFACSVSSEGDEVVNDLNESTYETDKAALATISNKKISIGSSSIDPYNSDFRQKTNNILSKIKQKDFSYIYESDNTWNCNGTEQTISSNINVDGQEVTLVSMGNQTFFYDNNDYLTATYSGFNITDTNTEFVYHDELYNIETCELEYKVSMTSEYGEGLSVFVSASESITDASNQNIVEYNMSCDGNICNITEKNQEFELDFDMETDDLFAFENYSIKGDVYYQEKENWDLNIKLNEILVSQDCGFDADYNYLCEVEIESDIDFVHVNIVHDDTVVEYFFDSASFMNLSYSNQTSMTIYKDTSLTEKVAEAVADENLRLLVYMYNDDGELETEAI